MHTAVSLASSHCDRTISTTLHYEAPLQGLNQLFVFRLKAVSPKHTLCGRASPFSLLYHLYLPDAPVLLPDEARLPLGQHIISCID
jgi:hypothetical protein